MWDAAILLTTRLFHYPKLFSGKKIDYDFSLDEQMSEQNIIFVFNDCHICIFLLCLENLFSSFQFLLKLTILQLKYEHVIDLF